MYNLTEITKRIKQVIDQSNLSTRKFASVIGVAQSTLNSAINGSRSPNLDIISRISDTFNVSMEWIMNGSGSPPSNINDSNVNMGYMNTINDTTEGLKEKIRSLEEQVSMLKEHLNQKDNMITLLHELITDSRNNNTN